MTYIEREILIKCFAIAGFAFLVCTAACSRTEPAKNEAVQAAGVVNQAVQVQAEPAKEQAVEAVVAINQPIQDQAEPTREGAVQVLRDFGAALEKVLEKDDYDKALTFLHLDALPPDDTEPPPLAEMLKGRVQGWWKSGAFSKQRIDALAQNGKWGKLHEVFDAARASHWAEAHQVPPESCYGLAVQNADEAGYYWDGRQFKIIYLSATADEKASLKNLVKQCLGGLYSKEGAAQGLSYYYLQQMGPEVEVALPGVVVPALTAALQHKNSYIRVQAAFTLWKVDRQPQMVSVLAEALKDESRALAADSLAQIGPAAKAAVPLLIEALKDQDAQIRVTAAWALWKVDHQEELAKSVLIEALKDLALKETVTDATSAQRRKEKDFGVFSIAAYALGEIGLDKAAILAITEALRADRDRNIFTGRVVPAFVKALKDGDVEVRKAAISVLALIGWSASAAVPALTEALQDQDAAIRASAAQALKKIE